MNKPVESSQLPPLTLTCGLCKGSGTRQSFGFLSSGDMDAGNEPHLITRHCDICHGKGWVYQSPEELTQKLLAALAEARITISCGRQESFKRRAQKAEADRERIFKLLLWYHRHHTCAKGAVPECETCKVVDGLILEGK